MILNCLYLEERPLDKDLMQLWSTQQKITVGLHCSRTQQMFQRNEQVSITVQMCNIYRKQQWEPKGKMMPLIANHEEIIFL